MEFTNAGRQLMTFKVGDVVDHKYNDLQDYGLVSRVLTSQKTPTSLSPAINVIWPGGLTGWYHENDLVFSMNQKHKSKSVSINPLLVYYPQVDCFTIALEKIHGPEWVSMAFQPPPGSGRYVWNNPQQIDPRTHNPVNFKDVYWASGFRFFHYHDTILEEQ